MDVVTDAVSEINVPIQNQPIIYYIIIVIFTYFVYFHPLHDFHQLLLNRMSTNDRTSAE